MRLTLGAGVVLARTGALPLPEASVDLVTCHDVLEFVSNDVGLIDEIARILAPHGTLSLRVPAAGPLAGIDAMNLMHYLVDTTKRGVRPHESSELGWRRHYRQTDLEEMLCQSRFEIVGSKRRRLAIAEAVDFLGMLLFRWLRPNVDRYRSFKRVADAIQRLESQIPTPFGSVVEITAERLRDHPRPHGMRISD